MSRIPCRLNRLICRGRPVPEGWVVVGTHSSPACDGDGANALVVTRATACTDTRTIRLSVQDGARVVDYAVTLHASEGPFTFGVNEEGMMAIRTHPELRLEGSVAKGHAINSEGDRDKPVWGKRAKWVDYWGPVDGKVVGVAILDHPSNPNHPTWWHARYYGLVAANPFGIHDFEKDKPEGAGDMKIASGGSVSSFWKCSATWPARSRDKPSLSP